MGFGDNALYKSTFYLLTCLLTKFLLPQHSLSVAVSFSNFLFVSIIIFYSRVVLIKHELGSVISVTAFDYLRRGGYVLMGVILLVCLSAGSRKTTQPIFPKSRGKMAHDPRKKPLDFGVVIRIKLRWVYGIRWD